MEHTRKMDSEHLLHCPICLEGFRKPRMLPCLHTFCESCLSKHIELHTSWSTTTPSGATAGKPIAYGIQRFPCPTCREAVVLPGTGIKGFRHDFRVLQMQDLLQEAISPRSRPPSSQNLCDFCKLAHQISIPLQYCHDCAKSLCDDCVQKHKKKDVFFGHCLGSPPLQWKQNLLCDLHQSETLDYFCLNCGTAVCSVCLMTTHDQHNVSELSAGLDNYEQSLGALRASLNTRTSQLNAMLYEISLNEKQCQTYYETSCKLVKQKSQEVMRAVQKQEKQLLAELQEQRASEMEQLLTLRNEIELSVVSMDSMQEFLSSVKAKPLQPHMLGVYQELEGKIDDALEKSLLLRVPACLSKCTFVPSQSSTSKIRLGEVVRTTYPDLPSIVDPSRDQMNTSIKSSRSKGNLYPDNFDYSVANRPQILPLVKFGSGGNASGQFDSPRDSCFIPNGCLVIADTNNNRLQVFDANGSLVTVIGEGNIKPWGVAATVDGNIAVADAMGKCIKVFTPEGALVKQFGKFLCPCGIAVNPQNGNFVVTDFFSSNVFILNAGGKLMKDFELRDHRAKHTSGPSRVAVAPTGQVVISDISNTCVKLFSKRGRLLHLITQSDCMSSPHGVCIDQCGHILVADSVQRQVLMFGPNGRLLYQLMSKQNGLKDPTGIDISAKQHLVVTQANANQVRVYKIETNPSVLLMKVPQEHVSNSRDITDSQ